MNHANFAPPPSMQSLNMSSPAPTNYSTRQETEKPNTGNNQYEPVLTNEYLTKFMDGHIGRKVKVYCAFTDSAQWHDMVFEGLVWGAGDDYLILYEEKSKKHTLIMAVYILYIEFTDISGTYQENI